MSVNFTPKASGRIHPLSPVLIDRIAAGEVIEGPYSVVKELVENSIDAGSTTLQIETSGGGLEQIVITDDGGGFHYDDLPAGITRHATSKISTLEDIESISGFGFRGEALAAIASVSHLEIKSRQRQADSGGRLECRGGELIEHTPTACNPGTIINVRELFYSTPARRRFLKSVKAEDRKIQREVIKIALAHPGIKIIFRREGREIFNLSPTEELPQRIGAIFGEKICNHLIRIDEESDSIKLSGYLTDENFFRGNRDLQFQYVNQRHVDLKYIGHLVKRCYGEMLPTGMNPAFFLFFEIPPIEVDCNVHPAKREVRLHNEAALNSFIMRTVSTALHPDAPINFNAHQKRTPFTERQRSTPLTGPSPVQNGNFDQLFSQAPETPAEARSYPITPPETTESDRDDRVATTSQFVPLRHFGILFGTYILAEGEDGFYLIDQHTAHERINYEKMRRNLSSLSGSRQKLLHPFTLECTEDECEEILANEEQLLQNGFLVESIGPRSLIVREIPFYIEPGSELETVEHLIRRVLDGEIEAGNLFDDYAALRACKASIKKNDVVAGETISEILTDLSRCEEPARCPHGRPTMIKFTQNELDRLFHRI